MEKPLGGLNGVVGPEVAEETERDGDDITYFVCLVMFLIVEDGDDVVDVAIDGACGECGDWWTGKTEG